MASIKLKGDTSGEVTIQAPAVAGTTTLNLPATSSTLATQNALGVRNLIINGDMRIDQRNAGSANTINVDGEYTLDRWKASSRQAPTYNRFTVQQVTDAPDNAVNSLKVTSLVSYTLASDDYHIISQYIEGTNIAHLGFGTANAKTVTVSFYVKSSLTGTFGGSLRNSSGTRSYPFSYTIDSANTWEKKTITIEGDTTGTWVTSTATGMILWLGLGVGSQYSGTAGAWSANNYFSTTGTTSVVGTSGATWQVSLVQLEIGTEATPFEHRPYDMELARCQRYYHYIGDGTTTLLYGFVISTSNNFRLYQSDFPVAMRANPTITYINDTGSFSTFRQDNKWFNAISNAGNTTDTETLYQYKADAEL